jgi:hypothetical protein
MQKKFYEIKDLEALGRSNIDNPFSTSKIETSLHAESSRAKVNANCAIKAFKMRKERNLTAEDLKFSSRGRTCGVGL